jgi:hypothetical protein
MEDGTRRTTTARTVGTSDVPSRPREATHSLWVLGMCALLLTIGGAWIGEAAETPTARVRSDDPALAALIDQATRRSDTFRRLLATIQASSGIVYVEPGPCGHGVRACLKMWMHVSGPDRFVRIMIQRPTTDTDVEVMSALGHELQHAIEVLSAPAVRDGVTMFNYLKRTAPTDNNRFETTAAINAGHAVYDELRRGAGIGR